MPKRLVAGDARAICVAKLDESRTAASAAAGSMTVAETEEQKRAHKEMVRATGRAAVNDALMSPSNGSVKRKASEMTAQGLTAAWLAYKEVYGTNGMAAGGASSSSTQAPLCRPEDIDPTVPVGNPSLPTSTEEAEATAPSDAPVEAVADAALLAADNEVQAAASAGAAISFFAP